MKSNFEMNNGRAWNFAHARKGLGVIVIFALAGIALGLRAYEQVNRKLASAQKVSAMNDSALEISRHYYLLQQLGDGKTDDVRKMLSFELVDDLQKLRSSAKLADHSQQEWVEQICQRILHKEKLHPGYFLSNSPSDRYSEELVWNALRENLPAYLAQSAPLSPGRGTNGKAKEN